MLENTVKNSLILNIKNIISREKLSDENAIVVLNTTRQKYTYLQESQDSLLSFNDVDYMMQALKKYIKAEHGLKI